MRSIASALAIQLGEPGRWDAPQRTGNARNVVGGFFEPRVKVRGRFFRGAQGFGHIVRGRLDPDGSLAPGTRHVQSPNAFARQMALAIALDCVDVSLPMDEVSPFG
jgi:hypothetical protein